MSRQWYQIWYILPTLPSSVCIIFENSQVVARMTPTALGLYPATQPQNFNSFPIVLASPPKDSFWTHFGLASIGEPIQFHAWGGDVCSATQYPFPFLWVQAPYFIRGIHCMPWVPSCWAFEPKCPAPPVHPWADFQLGLLGSLGLQSGLMMQTQTWLSHFAPGDHTLMRMGSVTKTLEVPQSWFFLSRSPISFEHS